MLLALLVLVSRVLKLRLALLALAMLDSLAARLWLAAWALVLPLPARLLAAAGVLLEERLAWRAR